MNFFIEVFCMILQATISSPQVLMPVQMEDRRMIKEVKLTTIGEFGVQRIARPDIPAHLHTGIDIKRPHENYYDEPILSIAQGVVISKRTDGPYAQLIIEHMDDGTNYWSVYEHISDISVNLHDKVDHNTKIARFFNKKELETYGWQFDHFHFEVLKKYPMKVSPNKATPERYFKSYTLTCFTYDDLISHFYDPIIFLGNN